MSLQTTININVDFYDKKYISINAKQYDSSSRWVAIICYNQGDIMNLSSSKHTAYIRYRKADGYGVVNSCRINYRGEVLIELTEQMLAADGICYVDLIIVNKGTAIVNVDTGEIITIDDSAILSTQAFCVNVYEAAVDNSVIESSYEFDAFNTALQKAEADYTEVIQLAKSYAIGDANDIRENEDFDNSKYYSLLSKSYAIGDLDGSTGTRDDENTENAKTYMETTKSHMDTTKDHMDTTEGYMNATNQYMSATQGYMNTTEDYMNTTHQYKAAAQGYMDMTEGYMKMTNQYRATTQEYMTTTQGYMDTTKSHMDNAETYMNNAKTSETNAATSEENASTSESNAQSYMNSAKEYMDNAKTSETNAKTSETNAATSETNAKNSETAASTSETNAATSASNASASEVNALNSANLSESYAVGGTGVRDGEDADNAKYYYEVISSIIDGAGTGIATVDEVKTYLGI